MESAIYFWNSPKGYAFIALSKILSLKEDHDNVCIADGSLRFVIRVKRDALDVAGIWIEPSFLGPGMLFFLHNDVFLALVA